MKPHSYRLSIAGIAAGALCLALAGGPALADPVDDKNESGKVLIYEEGSEPLKDGEVRITPEEDSTPPPAPEMRKDAEVRDNDSDNEDVQGQGGYLGVAVQDVTRELQKAKGLPRPEGALINSVDSRSPAYQAGIRRGDVIVEVDGSKIDQSSDLTSRVRDLDPGTKVRVVVLRNGDRRSFSVTVGRRPKGFISPRVLRWSSENYGDYPDMPPMGDQLDRIRVYRRDIQKQLNDIQEQLTRLREGDLQRLEDEIRALREELRARDESQKPRTN